MSIIVIRDGAATRLDTRPFALESDMQQQLGDHPEILPLHEISDDTAIVAVVRELTVSSGPSRSITLAGFMSSRRSSLGMRIGAGS